MYTEKLKFYPKHPSDFKTYKIETRPMPTLSQNEPFDVKTLFEEFCENDKEFFARYVDKRFCVTGVAKKVGPDIHNKPSIELSDTLSGKTYALVIFPTDEHYSRVNVGDTVTVCANYLVMSNLFGTVMKYSELLVACGTKKAEQSEENELEYRGDFTLNYPLFDGEKVIENASITVTDGKIVSVTEGECADSNYLLMPGLIDAHTHISSKNQTEIMLKNGITATCDVSASNSLIENSKQFTIISSAGMTMGTFSGKNYVKTAIQDGAKYIKVLLMEPYLMLKSALKDICDSAHENGIKVAVHAVSLKAVRTAVDCGADILIHVPMKEEFPKELAEEIAQKGMVVAPTLIMMKTFGEDGRNGYKPEHYRNAENAVRLLHECGVQILAATDANTGTYAPAVEYGTSLHTEMQLLVNAGLTPSEVLVSATSNVAKAFGISDIGMVSEGKRAVLLLIEGRPDKKIADTVKIKQIWIDGEPIL